MGSCRVRSLFSSETCLILEWGFDSREWVVSYLSEWKPCFVKKIYTKVYRTFWFFLTSSILK